MIDRMLSLVVAVSLALLVWLYARSRDQEGFDNVPVQVMLLEVPVHFLCPAGSPLRPRFRGEPGGRISLRVRGPIRGELPKIYAFVDLTQGRFRAGDNHEPIQIQLPKEFELVEEPPRGVSFQLVPADGAARDLVGVIPAP